MCIACVGEWLRPVSEGESETLLVTAWEREIDIFTLFLAFPSLSSIFLHPLFPLSTRCFFSLLYLTLFSSSPFLHYQLIPYIFFPSFSSSIPPFPFILSVSLSCFSSLFFPPPCLRFFPSLPFFLYQLAPFSLVSHLSL